jgi:hypothetical protein
MCDLDKGTLQVSQDMLLNQVRNQQLYNYPQNALLQVTGKRKGSFNNVLHHHHHHHNTSTSTGSQVTSIMGKQNETIVVHPKRKSLTAKPTVISSKKRSKTPNSIGSPNSNPDDDVFDTPPSQKTGRIGSGGYLDHSTGMITFGYSDSYPDICYLTELDLHFITKVCEINFTNHLDAIVNQRLGEKENKSTYY